MTRLLTTAAVMLATISTAQAFDSDIQAIIDQHKLGKRVTISEVAQLMSGSEIWCYAQEGSTCGWTEIYLDVTDAGGRFETAVGYDEAVNIAFIDAGTFKDDRYICQTGIDWVPTVRATKRSDGSLIGGRALDSFKAGIDVANLSSADDCFDYVYLRADADAQTVTLRQRQYVGRQYVPDGDVEVTVHFNAADAAGLTLQ